MRSHFEALIRGKRFSQQGEKKKQAVSAAKKGVNPDHLRTRWRKKGGGGRSPQAVGQKKRISSGGEKGVPRLRSSS